MNTSKNTFISNQRASIALESAVILPLVLLLSWGIFEYCAIMFGNAVIDHTLEEFAAEARLGCMEVSSISKQKHHCKKPKHLTIGSIKREIDSTSLSLVDSCERRSNTRFIVRIAPIHSASLTVNEFTKDSIDLGKESDLIVYSIHYRRNVFFPLFHIQSFRHMTHYTATTVIRNVEYGNSSLFSLPSTDRDRAC